MIGGRVNLFNMIPCVSLPNCMRCDLFRILKQFCCWCFFCGAIHIIRLKTIILISSSNHVVKNFRDIGSSSSAPGLKGNMAFRSRERAVAFGSLVGLPIVLDQTSGRQWTPWTTGLWWSSQTMLLYKCCILEYKLKNMSVGKFKSVNWFQFHHIKNLDTISGFTTFKYHLKAKCVDWHIAGCNSVLACIVVPLKVSSQQSPCWSISALVLI